MKLKFDVVTGLFAVAILLSSVANAQQRTSQVPLRASAYDVKHEATLAGTVLTFTENSQVAPAGAHVSVQTAAGTIDVHLGSGSYLNENHFSLSMGDFITLTGVSILTNTGPVFLARVVQKGGQSIAVRSTRGFPLAGYLSRQKVQQGTPQ